GISLFAVVYVAGITSITGGILAGVMAPGGILYLLVDRFLHVGDYYAVLSGILLVVTVLANPDGIASKLPRIPWPVLPQRPAARAASTEPRGTRTVPDRSGPSLSVEAVSVTYGAVEAATDITFVVRPG